MMIALLKNFIEQKKKERAREAYYSALASALAQVDLTGIDEAAQEFTENNRWV